MVDATNPAWRFESLVREILAVNGFEIGEAENHRFDFRALHAGEWWAAEVKYYRTAVAQIALIEAAAARLIEAARYASLGRGMLIVSANLPSAARDALEERYQLLLLDRVEVVRLASRRPELIDELRSVLEGDVPQDIQSVEHTVGRLRNTRPLTRAPVNVATDGAALCSRLCELKAGRPTWQKYERLCEDILHYLFADDLHGWHRQARSDDGFNRFDCVCRIKSDKAFWRFLVEHLDSRYVLFEFKNYIRKIKQGQILTTEKYLFARGLRRAAIVITRAGADDGAYAMIAGAMREHGKLILVLEDQQLCEMLHIRDNGEDPSDFLFDAADQFLLSLPR